MFLCNEMQLQYNHVDAFTIFQIDVMPKCATILCGKLSFCFKRSGGVNYSHCAKYRVDGMMINCGLFLICDRSLPSLPQAYSVYDEEIGYCQGQSFLAAVLLLHVS